MKHLIKYRSLLRLISGTIFLFLIVGLAFQPQFSTSATPILSITPITWNVIGLDSNNVNVWPNHFPVAARICNTGNTAANNVTANFVWDSLNSFIDTRPGTNTTLVVASLAASSCTDFYFEVEVERNA
ncbi:MAG: hypothetical protein QGD88_05265, partial [Anaerolineae bacterium]|nr:hypothetical protein [Anaerolineae bacterium]